MPGAPSGRRPNPRRRTHAYLQLRIADASLPLTSSFRFVCRPRSDVEVFAVLDGHGKAHGRTAARAAAAALEAHLTRHADLLLSDAAET